MIGRLRGTVVEAGDEELVLEVGGVGYLLRCGVRTLACLPPLGEEAVIQVESQWSELAGLRLYGFLTAAEKRAFTQLQAIQGVGPKAALAVLDVLSPAELDAAALRQDRAALTRAAGVGPKLAQRIVLELRSKPLTDEPLAAVSRLADGAAPMTPSSEAVSALVGLGWPEAVARRAVDRAADRLGEGVADGALIKAALQDLGR